MILALSRVCGNPAACYAPIFDGIEYSLKVSNRFVVYLGQTLGKLAGNGLMPFFAA